MSNITQVVNVDKNMKTLKKGIIASGLNKLLSETGPFTVFAPSDQAFAKLDGGVLESLLQPENKTKLVDVLNHHVVAGKIAFLDLKDGEKITTIGGRDLQVHIKDGAVSIEGANVNSQEVETSNGNIYSLDAVMMKN